MRSSNQFMAQAIMHVIIINYGTKQYNKFQYFVKLIGESIDLHVQLHVLYYLNGSYLTNSKKTAELD